eukprot:scaffold82538_cov60-Phaeocystis_antarctica.AAC.1
MSLCSLRSLCSSEIVAGCDGGGVEAVSTWCPATASQPKEGCYPGITTSKEGEVAPSCALGGAALTKRLYGCSQHLT